MTVIYNNKLCTKNRNAANKIVADFVFGFRNIYRSCSLLKCDEKF